jgi:TRAP-type C4-dicarboxylate transport system permease small subunit
VKSVLDKIEKGLNLFVSILIGCMMVWVFVQVITRYCFSYTPSYGEELARYMFVWVVFLSLPIVAKRGGHMAIEMITVRVKGRILKTIRIVADIFTLAFLALMVVQGTFMTIKSSIQTSAALEIPMSWVYCVMPIGCLIMLANVLYSFVNLIRTPADKL